MRLKRELLTKYIILYIILISTVFYYLDSDKNRELQEHLESQKRLLKKEIEWNAIISKKYIDIFFDNKITNSHKILDIVDNLNKNQNDDKEREVLYSSLKESFYSLKSLGIKQLNFISVDNKVLLRMHDKKRSLDSLEKNREDIVHFNKNRDDFSGFSLNNYSAGYSYIKSIYNYKNEFLGSVEFVYTLDEFSKSIEESSNFRLFYAISSSYLEKSLFKEYITNFKSTTINSDYLIENTIYVRYKDRVDLNLELLNQKEKELSKSMYKGDDFSTYFYFDNNYYSVHLLAIKDYKSDILGYIIAFNLFDNMKISLINEKFYSYFILLSMLILLVELFIIFYYTRNKKYKTLLKNQKLLYDGLDKYVLMTKTDTKGMIRSVTQAFCDVSGYTKDEIIGKSHNIIRHPDMSRNFFDKLWSTIKRGRVWEGEIKNIDKKGRAYWVRGVIYPEFDESGKIVAFCSIRVNITGEKELDTLNKKLQSSIEERVHNLDLDDFDKKSIDKKLKSEILDVQLYKWKKAISSINLLTSDLRERIEDKRYDKVYLESINDKIFTHNQFLKNSLKEFEELHGEKSREKNIYNIFQEIIHQIQIGNIGSNILFNLDGDSEICVNRNEEEINIIISKLLKSIVITYLDLALDNIEIDISFYKSIEHISIIINIEPKIYDDSIAHDVFDLSLEKTVFENSSMSIVKLFVSNIEASIECKCSENSNSILLKFVDEIEY